MHTVIRFRRATALSLTAFISLAALGQTAPALPSPDAAVTLAPMVVTGVQPGPALWKVSKHGHVMWVLGITSPLPKGMRWDSSKLERLIASSQLVLRPPSMEIGVKAGFWG